MGAARITIFSRMMNQGMFRRLAAWLGAQALLRRGGTLMFMLASALLCLALSGGQPAHAQKSYDTPEQPPVEELPDFDGAGPVSISVPSTIAAGSRVTATVTMQNTGTTTWWPGMVNPYRLGSQLPADNLTWGVGRVELPSAVGPGSNAVFTFTITAPSTPGTYNFGWAMLREGMHWFGYTASSTVNVVAPTPVYDAQLVSANVPTQIAPGSTYNASLTFRNTGNTTWTSPDFLLANQDDKYTFGMNRVNMSTASVAPGQSTTFNFQVRAPATAGTYAFQWGMVWEFHQRFGQISSSNVTVSAAGPTNTVTYIHTDGLGSPVARTDASGNVISRTRYEPYGYVASGTQPTIGFTGHVNDADTGLTYMQQRYYDPVAGRFLSIDPVTTDANTGGSFNRYGYANDSPYKYIDADGRLPILVLVPLALEVADKVITAVDIYQAAQAGGASAAARVAVESAVANLIPGGKIASKLEKSAAAALPRLKGMRAAERAKVLREGGFEQTKVSNSVAKNETWSHKDGSEVRVHPYGNEKTSQYASGNNAHAHKQDPGGNQLNDRGNVSRDPNDTHIGLPNPPDLPRVRGRDHGE